MNKIRAGIAGAAGYTGGELIRLLLHHPNVDITFCHSYSQGGRLLSEVHTDLLGDTDLVFATEINKDIDVIFLCMGHGESKKFIEAHALPDSIAVIDLSQDFRLDNNWVYGLPELNKGLIQAKNRIANPGCFATSIQLALLPLAKAGLITADVHISATTGSTGAGQSLSPTSHFSWRSNNFSSYKEFEHQHLAEIGNSLQILQPGFEKDIHFIPYRGSFTRGILASVYTECRLSLDEAKELYQGYYKEHPFTWISPSPIDVKQVVNTNKCFLHLARHGNNLLITSIIDNLLKGASGQAVQNMNLVFGLDETAGLRLKATAF